MASGRVRVSPGMFETKVMMAPNSPRLAANAVMAPAMMPGSAKGSVMVTKRSTGPAPKVAAAAIRPGSIASMASRTARTWNGKVTMAAASAAPVQLKTKRMFQVSRSQAPIGPRVPKVTSRR